MYALCDCNNFYASAERLFNPALRQRPIVVLSNNDGCIIARSEEAKECGIKMGDAEFLVRQRLKENNVFVFSSNYVLYGDISKRVMQNLARWFPRLAAYSIDEAFAWIDRRPGLDDYVKQIRENVVLNTGIPVSIGVAPNKTLAKMANKLAKRAGGTLVLATRAEIDNAVNDFAIEDIWGIGGQFYKKLEDMGVKTAAELRNLPEMWLKKHMTVQGQRLWRDLWGYEATGFDMEPVRAQMVSVSRSFKTYITDKDELCEAITAYATRTAEKLREQGMLCTVVEVFLLTNKHREDHKQHAPSHLHKFTFATCNTLELVKAACKIACMLFVPGVHYRKAGIIAGGLIAGEEIQLNIFEDRDDLKVNNVSRVIDTLNDAFGRGKVRLASEGFKKAWTLKHEHLSKGYTTRWEDIIAVK